MAQQCKWEFRNRFRINAFGWKGSSLAIKRLDEAVKEIRKTKDPIFRAEGAILLCERMWPALQQIDSSSGALGTATNKAVHELVQFMDRRRFSWTLIWGRVPVSKEIDNDDKQQERNSYGTTGRRAAVECCPQT